MIGGLIMAIVSIFSSLYIILVVFVICLAIYALILSIKALKIYIDKNSFNNFK